MFLFYKQWRGKPRPTFPHLPPVTCFPAIGCYALSRAWHGVKFSRDLHNGTSGMFCFEFSLVRCFIYIRCGWPVVITLESSLVSVVCKMVWNDLSSWNWKLCTNTCWNIFGTLSLYLDLFPTVERCPVSWIVPRMSARLSSRPTNQIFSQRHCVLAPFDYSTTLWQRDNLVNGWRRKSWS